MESCERVQMQCRNPSVREGARSCSWRRGTLPYGRVSANFGNNSLYSLSNFSASRPAWHRHTGGAKMFTNLIESQSHRKEFKRRSSFVLVTVAAYAVLLFGAGIASIYAYDAQLETQTSRLKLLNWVQPVTTDALKPDR